MATLSRDNRAAAEFAHAYATRVGLDRGQHDLLVAKTEALVDWLKRFRRTLSFAMRYPVEHPQRQAVVDDLLRDTQTFIHRYGPLVLRFAPDHSETDEGFHMPAAADSEFGTYTFYPMFRDGIASLRLVPGAGTAELNLLLDVIAARGRRDGDDTYTWIWRARPPSLELEMEPSLTADVATALAAHQSEDPALEAFLSTLVAADPFYSASDPRTTFSADTLDGLAQQGIDPDRARRMLLDPNAAGEAPEVDAAAAASLRTLYGHGGDREARVAAIRTTHGGGGNR